MCQSIQTIYKFCGCQGEFYQQKCPAPTATCHLLLNNPTTLSLTCYCERHSSTTFKTVRQDQRETARFNKEYNKILAREKEQKRTEQGTMNIIRAGEREQRQRDVDEFRRQERAMEEYRRKDVITRSKVEDYGRRKAQEEVILREAGLKKLGEKSDARCVVM